MKRIATLMIILMMGLTASAHSIRYFTYSQAERTVRYLNAQNEMMIYCGYDYEIETYVLINEVWMERVNSAYYEIWVFGYDAYTGDEVYMPLDLGCVWLFSAGHIYSAAQYLRFHAAVRTPSITWYVPVYNPYTRMMHRTGYTRSYHYDVHCHGWRPPMNNPSLPPYYMRQPQDPAPRPSGSWTPGTDRPQVSAPSTAGRTGTAGRVTTGSSQPTTGGTSTGSSRGTSTGTTTSGSSRGTSTGTTNSGSSRGTSTGTTNSGSSRGTSTGTTNSGSSRGTSTGTTNSGSSRGTTTGTTPTRSNATATSSRSTSTSTSTPASSTDKPKTNTRSTSTTSSSRSTSSTTSSSRSTTSKSNTRATSTTSNTRGTSTSTRGNSTQR